MAGNAGTLELLALELARALQPLGQRLSGASAEDFIAELGLRLPAGMIGQVQVTSAFGATGAASASLGPLVVELDQAIAENAAAQIARLGKSLITALNWVIDGTSQLGAALSGAAATLPGLTLQQRAEIQAFAAELPRRLLAAAVVEHVRGKWPTAVPTLALLGLIDDEVDPGDPDNPLRPPSLRRAVHLDRVFDLLLDPAGFLGKVFGFGQPTFDPTELFRRVAAFLAVADLPAVLIAAPGLAPILEAYLFRLGLDPADPRALTVRLRTQATEDYTRSYKLPAPWSFELGAFARFEEGLEGTVTPPLEVSLRALEGALALRLSALLAAERPGSTMTLLGQAGGSRLEARRFAARLALDGAVDPASGTVTGEPVAEVELAGGRLDIDLSAADGFLTSLIGDGRLEAGFDLPMLLDASRGLRFRGSDGLEAQLPVHVELGALEVRAVYLAAHLDGPGVAMELSAGLRAQLGPVQATVERLGILAELGFPPDGGNLGPAELQFAFKPPDGIGLRLEAGPVAGGGFLGFDPDRGEYAGELELEFAHSLTLKGIGLISTRAPDGTAGFSLLVILTGEFPGGGLQLGFGFRLLAVGGLIGLNRTMRLDALVEGVRSGALESIMFPRDVVANAPRIISDLQAFFPAEEGRLLIGPMAKLGWGTPTLISLSVAVIVEVPGNIAAAGLLRVALPDPEAAIVVLQANFVAVIEPDRQRLYFFGAMFDSRVLTTTIDGEMGVLAAWGDEPNLVLTVGGFNPGYTPPPLPFPNPNRVAINLLNEPNARMRVLGYFAITSNTVQFGAHAEMYFRFSEFSVEGHVGFDALFRFSPFEFQIEVSASLALKAFGVGVFSVRLRFRLEGPTPWHARGRGSISVWFFEISADFDFTWGEERDITPPQVDVLPLLAAELAKPEGWQTQAPADGAPLVTLRQLAATEDDLVLHPLGTLSVRQRAVPLDLRLDKVGAQQPRDANRFTVTVPNGPLAKRGDLDELFALAQFQEMDDAEKLSRRPFERQHGGLELEVDGAAMASSRVVRRSARYERIILDTDDRHSASSFSPYPTSLFSHLLDGDAASRSPLSRHQAALRQPFSDTIRTGEDRYTVARTLDNRAAAPKFEGSEAAARQELAARLAAKPQFTGLLHVIPSAELHQVVVTG